MHTNVQVYNCEIKQPCSKPSLTHSLLQVTTLYQQVELTWTVMFCNLLMEIHFFILRQGPGLKALNFFLSVDSF